MRVSKIALTLSAFVFLTGTFLPSCTSVKLDSLKERFRENFDGTLTVPGNITVATPTNFSFVFFGDTHIGNPGGEMMKQIIAQGLQDGDSFFIVGGDLTDNGDAGQFRQYLAVMNDAGATSRAVLGNHDIFFDGWSNFKNILGRSIYSFDAGPIHFSMLDSANGVLGIDQLRWLESDLAATTQPIKIVVSHFAPWNGHFSSMFKMSSDEEAAILKDMLDKYNVNFMLAGHYHGYDQIKLGATTYIISGGANTLNDPGQRKHFLRIRVQNGIATPEIVYLP